MMPAVTSATNQTWQSVEGEMLGLTETCQQNVTTERALQQYIASSPNTQRYWNSLHHLERSP